MGRSRRPKRYSDPYGKNRPLKVWQGRCRNARCNAATYIGTLKEYGMLCSNCYDEIRIRKLSKNHEIVPNRMDELNY